MSAGWQRFMLWSGVLALAVAVLFLVFGQHSDTKHFHHEDIAPHDMDMWSGEATKKTFTHKELVVLRPPITISTSFGESIGVAQATYQRMVAGFVAENVQAIDEAANHLRRIVEDIDASELSPKAKDAWHGHRQVLRTSLHQLEQTKTMEGKRRHLSHISEAMYCVLKSFRVPVHVNVAFCTAALGGRGAYWLTRSAHPRNPYGAPADCATVRERIFHKMPGRDG